MDIFHGYQFEDFVKRQMSKQISEALLDRAVKNGIITHCGADYYRRFYEGYR